jgi:mono/diheme cytochrome c family protein
MTERWTVIGSSFVFASLLAFASWASGQDRSAHAKLPAETPAIIRTTMAELHAHGGVPRGWKFLIPPGDAAEGRKVFVGMECFACHDVKGEDFPHDGKAARGAGPELTGMGSHHPAEYFAESILNPNRVIVQGPGYTGADGLSKMPSYADTMTLKQLMDVVAYLGSLKSVDAHHGQQMGGSMKMDMPMKMK